jgi:hypothetical protein
MLALVVGKLPVERSVRMSHPRRIAILAATGIAAMASTAAAVASAPVTPARGATRASLIHAFVVQDGSNAGISGAYVTGSRPVLGVVCQKTPDGRLARFVFRSSGRSWRFVLETTGSSTGNSAQRALERACH